MSRVVKLAKTVRNHWKKSAVAAVAAAFGVKYADNRLRILLMMRGYCEESKSYGDQTVRAGDKPRHVTVVLNPAAKNGKSLASFEKYVAPLLHLAGIRVSLVKTEHEGQAKALLEVMDNTDAVLVAGGDGTLLEVVTGLCRREDSAVATQRFPIGIIPVGQTNSVAKRLFWDDHSQEAKLLAESAMAVVKWNTRPLSVMAIESESGNPVFAVSKLEWGIFRDVNCKISKYWYWGPLKSKMAYVFASLKKIGKPVEATLSFSPPCDGCSKCHASRFGDVTTAASEKQPNHRWWHAFIPRKPTRDIGVAAIDYGKVINDDCGQWSSIDVSATDLLIESVNVLPNCKRDKFADSTSLRIKIGPSRIGRIQYMLEGWKRNDDVNRDDEAWTHIIDADGIKIEPKINEESDSWYSIDNEDHEAKFVHIQLQPKKINVFCKHD